jgi:hypothetical protein
MGIRIDKYLSNISRIRPIAGVSIIGLRYIKWLIWFISVTEEDRWEAGIYYGRNRYYE